MGEIEQRELSIYISNNAQLNRQQEVPIQQNLLRKMGNRNFDFEKSKILWKHLADNGAKAYEKEFGGRGTFTVADRKAVAAEFAKDFVEEVKQGNHTVIISKAEQAKRKREKKLKTRTPTQKQLDRGR